MAWSAAVGEPSDETQCTESGRCRSRASAVCVKKNKGRFSEMDAFGAMRRAPGRSSGVALWCRRARRRGRCARRLTVAHGDNQLLFHVGCKKRNDMNVCKLTRRHFQLVYLFYDWNLFTIWNNGKWKRKLTKCKLRLFRFVALNEPTWPANFFWF